MVLIIYSLESLLLLFDQKKGFSSDDLKNKRIEIAKKKGVEFDTRSPEEAFLDFSKKDVNLKPKFFYSPIFRFSSIFQNARNNGDIIPFRGPLDSRTLSCAEEGKYKLSNSDKFGFKNFNSIYKKKINTILLGDSLAEGDCQSIKNDIAGNLTREGFTTVNFGVTGTSVLVALGIMREFGGEIRPKNYVYLYSEENDLEGLNWSKKDSHLMKYLNGEYNINYINRYDEIELFLTSSSKETISRLNNRNKNKKLNSKSNFEIIKNNLIDILEIKRIKKFIRYKIFKKKYLNTDLDLFFLTIKKMDEEAKKNNSKFIFVYLPSSTRYFFKTSENSPKINEQINHKKIILDKLENMGVSIIDITLFLEKAPSVKPYFSLGYFGHFNTRGYKKIAEMISFKLK